MKKLVADAMLDGALGLSTSLQYVPARFAKTPELIELAKVARQYGGIYATHQRSEANTIDASLNEVFEIAQQGSNPGRDLASENCVQEELGPHASRAHRESSRHAIRVSTSPPTSIRTSPAARRSRVSATVGARRWNRKDADTPARSATRANV